jgi:hypothetical protein
VTGDFGGSAGPARINEGEQARGKYGVGNQQVALSGAGINAQQGMVFCQ